MKKTILVVLVFVALALPEITYCMEEHSDMKDSALLEYVKKNHAEHR